MLTVTDVPQDLDPAMLPGHDQALPGPDPPALHYRPFANRCDRSCMVRYVPDVRSLLFLGT